MGYTHHFERNLKGSAVIDDSVRHQIIPILQSIVSRYEDILTDDPRGRQKLPVVITEESDEIFFNGIDDERGKNACETFCFNLRIINGHSFCKTDQKPYDKPVCEVLLVLCHFLPGLDVRSNGFLPSRVVEEWLEAAENVRREYGITTRLFHWKHNPPLESCEND